jgi:tetratricopeptide (TPR) repeat protein
MRAGSNTTDAASIREKSLGPDHPDVGFSLNNLALVYMRQGRFTEAEPVFRRSLAIFEKALGAEHPNVGKALGNLAALYQSQGVTATPNRFKSAG